MFGLRSLGRLLITLAVGVGFVAAALSGLQGQNAAISTGLISVDGRSLTRNNRPFTIHGVNYYAQGAGWDDFWLRYGETAVSDQINQELNKAAGLGINTVRLFTPYRLFSGTVATPYPGYLADFITRLEQREMVAIVTLFDLYPRDAANPYTTANYTADKLHIDTVINTLGNDNPTILAWDLKNEMDRDYGFGKENVTAWANEMISYVRTIDPNHLLTIGFYGVTTGSLCYDTAITNADVFAANIVSEWATAVDFVSMHYYLSERCFPGDLQSLQTAIGNKPLVLEEFGLHTKADAPSPHTEVEQAAYYNALLALSEANKLAGTIFRTLNDFTQVPASFAPTEQCLGVLRNSSVTICEAAVPENYSEKPAAAVVRRHFQFGTAYIDLFNGLVDQNSDAPPASWSDNWQQGGGLLRGYHPGQLLWSHSAGHVAFSKFVSNTTSITGLATSPVLSNINVTRTPFLNGRIRSYTIRDPIYGQDSSLHIGVQADGHITRLLTITPGASLPRTFNIDLRRPPLNWSGEQTLQIVLELVPDISNGYSATYEFDWIAIEGHRLYLPLLIK